MYGPSFMLNQGLELELHADLKDVLDLLDKEVPKYVCDDYKFKLGVAKGVLGSEWQLVARPIEAKTGKPINARAGYVVVRKQDNGTTSLLVPPKEQWGDPNNKEFDPDGTVFTRFALKILKTLGDKGWIDLPGPIPDR
jgi:hypothetical protein